MVLLKREAKEERGVWFDSSGLDWIVFGLVVVVVVVVGCVGNLVRCGFMCGGDGWLKERDTKEKINKRWGKKKWREIGLYYFIG